MIERPVLIAWDDDGEPVMLAGLGATTRWAPARGRSTTTIYEVCEGWVEQRQLWRTGSTWTLGTAESSPLATYPADPSDDPRVLGVVSFVEESVASWAIGLRVAEKDWRDDDLADVVGTWAPFGFLPPWQDTDGEWYWRYCPERIAAQTAELPDRAFATYLDQLLIRLGLCVNNPDLEAHELERLIDDAVYHASPKDAARSNEIQMRAMDRR